MALRNGLYIMVVAEVEDKKDNSDEFSRCLGAAYVGEMPRQFREFFFHELCCFFWHDERDWGEQDSSYISLYDHVIPDNDAQSASMPNENEMLRLVCKSRMMPPNQRETLDIAVGIANDIKQIIVETDAEDVELEDIADILEQRHGRWVTFNDFTNPEIVKVHYEKGTLRTYRDKITWSLKDPTIGRDRGGNFLKRAGNKPNSSYHYFLQSDNDNKR
jgi:hypothetical protein